VRHNVIASPRQRFCFAGAECGDHAEFGAHFRLLPVPQSLTICGRPERLPRTCYLLAPAPDQFLEAVASELGHRSILERR
jgi:hypothetical protein